MRTITAEQAVHLPFWLGAHRAAKNDGTAVLYRIRKLCTSAMNSS